MKNILTIALLLVGMMATASSCSENNCTKDDIVGVWQSSEGRYLFFYPNDTVIIRDLPGSKMLKIRNMTTALWEITRTPYSNETELDFRFKEDPKDCYYEGNTLYIKYCPLHKIYYIKTGLDVENYEMVYFLRKISNVLPEPEDVDDYIEQREDVEFPTINCIFEFG